MRSIALMHVLIWKVKHSVVYVKPIAMHLIIVKKIRGNYALWWTKDVTGIADPSH